MKSIRRTITLVVAFGVQWVAHGEMPENLAEKYPAAKGAFDLIEKYPLIHQALMDDHYLARLSTEPAYEVGMRKKLADAKFRKFGSERSVRVQLQHATVMDGPSIILEYQTEWDQYPALPSGGPAQTHPVQLGDGRDSMWHRTIYGGTDDAAAHAEFEALLDRWRKMPSNRRTEIYPELVTFAKEHLPSRPLSEVREDVKGQIQALVKAFAPYGARELEHPQLGHYGARITDRLYLYIRDFPEEAPTRFAHDPFFWLIVSGGPKAVPADYLPAFPGAEGMGAMATGGRGGEVIYVTNTNPTGPGSLAEALQTPGARTVLFTVSGQINLPDNTWITHPDLTLIGYTAPGEGVEVNGRLCVAADNIIMRGMRWRLRPPNLKDGMSTLGRPRNIVFDHCSFAYGSDELLRMIGGNSSFYGFTIQYCILGPGLAGTGDHPYGPEVGGYGTFHHNFFNNTLSRSPEVDCILIDWRHNIMANQRSGHSLRPQSRFNMVGNYIVDIPDNPNEYSFQANDSVYLAHNIREHGDRITEFKADYDSTLLEQPHRAMPVKWTDAKDLEEVLIPNVGAFLPVRDSTDLHYIETFRNRTAKLPHLKDGVWKPYGPANRNMDLYEMWEDSAFPPPAAGATGPVDTDGDGLPDEWELANGLNPNNPRDGSADPDNDGYTNLEEFLNRTDPSLYVDYTLAENNIHTLQ